MGLSRATKVAQLQQASSIRRNFSWVLVGNLVFSACNWSLMIVLAKLTHRFGEPGSSATYNVGLYSMGVAVTQPVFSLAALQLRAVLAVDSKEQHRFGIYFGLRIALTLVALLVCAGVGLFGLHENIDRLIVYATALGAGFDCIGDILQAYLQRWERMERVGLSMLYRGLLTLILFTIAYIAFHSVVWAIVGSGLASLVVAFFYDLPNAIKMARVVAAEKGQPSIHEFFNPVLNKKEALDLLKTCWPLGLTSALITLNVYVGRLIVFGLLGKELLGEVSGSQNLVALGQTALIAIGTAVSAPLARHYQAGNMKEFRRVTNKFLLISILIGLAGVVLSSLFGRWIITTAFKQDFYRHPALFPTLMVSGLLLYTSLAFGSALTSAKHFTKQLTVAASVMITALISGYLLVSMYGVMGAAYSAVLAMAVRLLLMAGIYYKEILQRPASVEHS